MEIQRKTVSEMDRTRYRGKLCLKWIKEIQVENFMKIRTATIKDLKKVTEVEASCFPPAEAASEQSFADRLAVYADHFWLLEKDGELVSFVNGMVTDEPDLADEMYSNASMHKETGKWQMIFGVNTLPQYRRQGFAEMVLNQVIADAREQGRKGLVLTCKEHMLHYYAKFGFVNEGLSESSHGDAVWYQMRLSFETESM